MKRLLQLPVLALGFALALVAAGCAHSSSSSSARHRMTNTVALALTVNGGQQPTPEQFALVFAAAEPQLAALGWVLVTDVTQADRIVRVDFTPDAVDPNKRGHAVYLGMTWNARGPYATALAYANANASYSLASYTPSYGSPFLGYDRYDRWDDGSYTYSNTPTVTTGPGANRPPHVDRGDHGDRHHGGGNNPNIDCPPPTNPPPRYVDHRDGSNPGNSNRGSWRGHAPRSDDSSYSRSDAGRSSSSSSDNSSSGSSSGSYSSSSSSPSYSSSSSDFSSSSSSSSSADYSSGSNGGGPSANNTVAR